MRPLLSHDRSQNATVQTQDNGAGDRSPRRPYLASTAAATTTRHQRQPRTARASPRHPALPPSRPPAPPVVVALDPEKLYAGKKEQIDYLRVDRTRERRYDFDHAFGPKANNEEVGRVGFSSSAGGRDRHSW